MRLFLTRLGVSWGEVAIACISLAASVAVHLFSALRFPNDDQFITFRYIDHLASGQGFVYNLGDHVLGTTTPLFTLMGALLKLLLPAVPTPELMAWANTVLLALGAVLVFRVLSRLMGARYAFIGSLVFIFDLAKAVPEGMESPLFIFLILNLILALMTRRHAASATYLALSCLTRPDAGLVAMLVFFFWWHEDGLRSALRGTVVTLLVALPWLLFAVWYFGSPIPQSLIAKMHGHDIYIIPAVQAFKVQLAALSRIYWGSFFDPDNLLVQTLCNLLPFLALATAGAWRLVRQGWWIIPAVPLAYFATFSLSNPILFPWYSTQMEPVWILLSWVGVIWLIGMLPRYVRLGVLALLLAGPLLLWAQLVVSTDVGSKGALFTIGNYLREHAHPTETIALSNIGIVGYVTDGYIIDTIGLTFPQASTFYPWSDECRDMTNLYQIPPALVQSLEPDWLVAGAAELTPCFKESDWFLERYHVVWNQGPGGTDIWAHR